MNIINTLTIKHLKMNKKRTLVTIIGIVLTSCLLFTIGLGASTLRQNSIDYIIRYAGYQHVTFNDLPYSHIETLKNDRNIERIVTEKVVKNYTYKIDGHYNTEYNLILVSVDVPYNEYITLANGDFPNKENEIIISFSLAQNQNYETGGVLHGNKIVGIYKSSKLHHYDSENMYHIDSEYIYGYNNANMEGNVNFYVNYKSLKNIYDKIYQTAENLGIEYKIDKEYRNYDNTLINYSLLQAYGKYIGFNLQLAVYLALGLVLTILSIVCIFVIHNSFAISLSERKKHIGILKSIGATQKQLFISVFYEAGILSLISIPIGFLLSFVLDETVLLIVNNMLKYSEPIPFKLVVYPSFVITSLVFILITIFLSARFSAFKASRITPIELVRMNSDIGSIKSKDHKLIKKLFGPEGELAYKNIKRNKRKYKVTVTSLCISIVLFITFSTYLNYFIFYSENTYTTEYDILINVPEIEYQNQIISEILKIGYIDESVQYKSLSLNFKAVDKELFTDKYYEMASNHSLDYISVRGLDDNDYNEYKKRVGLKDDSKIILYNNTVYSDRSSDMNDVTYVSMNVFKKENVTLEMCNGVYVPTNNHLKGTYNIKDCYLTLDNFHFTNTQISTKGAMGLTIIVDMNKYDEIKNIYNEYNELSKYFTPDTIQLGINSKNFKQFDEEMTKIIDKYPNVDLYYWNFKLENYKQDMSIMALRFVLYSIVAFITIIAITSVFNTINTSISLREREFSMLRSIGLSQKGFNKMLKLESIFLGLKTLLYGIPISLFIILLIFFIDYIGSEKTTMLFPTKYFIICFIAILLIIYITMRYSIKKIKHKNIVDSIKNENI